MAHEQLTVVSKQRGAAMVVCLVILLIVTIITAAGIGSASMQQKMAANAQQQNETFQAAEGTISAALATINGSDTTPGDSSALNQALLKGLKPATPYSLTNTQLTKTGLMDVNTVVIYLSSMATSVGNSLDADENSTIIPGHRFVIEGQAEMTTGARTQIEQGIEYD